MYTSQESPEKPQNQAKWLSQLKEQVNGNVNNLTAQIEVLFKSNTDFAQQNASQREEILNMYQIEKATKKLEKEHFDLIEQQGNDLKSLKQEILVIQKEKSLIESKYEQQLEISEQQAASYEKLQVEILIRKKENQYLKEKLSMVEKEKESPQCEQSFLTDEQSMHTVVANDFGDNIEMIEESESKVIFRRKDQNKGWDNSYGLTKFLSSNEKTNIRLSLLSQQDGRNDWRWIYIHLIGSDIDPNSPQENLLKTKNQLIKYPYYGIYPYKPLPYNVTVQKKDKGILKQSEKIIITFDPKERRLEFKSRTFTCFSENILVKEKYRIAVYMSNSPQSMSIEYLDNTSEIVEK